MVQALQYYKVYCASSCGHTAQYRQVDTKLRNADAYVADLMDKLRLFEGKFESQTTEFTKLSSATEAALQGLDEKLNFKRPTVTEFLGLAAVHLDIKKKYVESFTKANTNRIMNISYQGQYHKRSRRKRHGHRSYRCTIYSYD